MKNEIIYKIINYVMLTLTNQYEIIKNIKAHENLNFLQKIG